MRLTKEQKKFLRTELICLYIKAESEGDTKAETMLSEIIAKLNGIKLRETPLGE